METPNIRGKKKICIAKKLVSLVEVVKLVYWSKQHENVDKNIRYLWGNEEMAMFLILIHETNINAFLCFLDCFSPLEI